jgi:uncharacterized membrane protein
VLRLEAFSLSGFFFFLHLSICLSKLGFFKYWFKIVFKK